VATFEGMNKVYLSYIWYRLSTGPFLTPVEYPPTFGADSRYQTLVQFSWTAVCKFGTQSRVRDGTKQFLVSVAGKSQAPASCL